MKKYQDLIDQNTSLTLSESTEACRYILKTLKSLDASSPDYTRFANEVATFLVALHAKKESDAEILGFLDAVRETALPFPKLNHSLLDVCGTGGDCAQTFNVSTGVAMILASLDVKVAKHGNRGVSSKSGSSDVLSALKIKSDTSAEESVHSLAANQISFLFAPAFYPILAHVAPIRKSIGKPTLFNLLGPLLNPALITHQLMGVYDKSLLLTSAQILRFRGVKKAFVVTGSDGLDEITLSGPTFVTVLEDGDLKHRTLMPEDFGLETATLDQVRGGTPAENAEILARIFSGERSAKRDLLVINAAAALVVAEQEDNFKDAASRVGHALDQGFTLNLLQRLQKRAQTLA